MQANKDKSYQIKESETDHYHVEFIRHEKPKNSMKTIEKKMVQIFGIRDFQNIKRTIEGDGKLNGGTGIFVTGWHEMRVIHDPVLWKEEAERKAEAEAKKEAAKTEREESENKIPNADGKAEQSPKRKAKV